MLKEFTLSVNNTKIVELSLVYWFLEKLPFADSIKENEREDFQKMKRKKKKNWLWYLQRRPDQLSQSNWVLKHDTGISRLRIENLSLKQRVRELKEGKKWWKNKYKREKRNWEKNSATQQWRVTM